MKVVRDVTFAFVAAVAFLLLSDVVWADDDQLILYDVRPSSSGLDLDNLKGLPLRHIFKVPSVNRYFVVVENDQSEAIQKLKFPNAPKVIQYPVGNVCNFLSGYGVPQCDVRADASFREGTLTYIKFQFQFPESMSTDEVTTMLSRLETTYNAALKCGGAEVYNNLGKYPPRLFFFTDLDQETAENMVDAMVSIAGPGNVVSNLLRIREIPIPVEA